eukprot:scaffold90559_cov18-Phaeocystis_antarctica.AAC.1
MQQQQQQHAAVEPFIAPSTPPTVLRPTSLEPPPPPQPPSPTLTPSAAPPPASQHNPSAPGCVTPPGSLPDVSEIKFELGASSLQRGSKLRGGGGGTRRASKGSAFAAPLPSPIVPSASPAPPPKVAWAQPADPMAPLHPSTARPGPGSPAAAADAVSSPPMQCLRRHSVGFSMGEEPRSRSKGSGKRAARRQSFGMKGSPDPNQKRSPSAVIGTPSGAS